MPADSCQRERNEGAGLDEAALPEAHRGVFVYAYGGVFGEVTWQRKEERKTLQEKVDWRQASCVYVWWQQSFLAYG